MTFPSQSQLLLPLLGTLQREGGALSAKAACDALAARVGLSPEDQAATVTLSSGRVGRWARHVRFVRQRAVDLGFISGEVRNLWAVTPAGRNGLRDAQHGIVVNVYVTDRGVALWATAETAVQVLANGSVTTIVTSPPYPLRTAKAYQSDISTDEYIEWMLSLASDWHRTLADDGTLVLNLGSVYETKMPTLSLYREELYLALRKQLGFHLASDFYWNSRSKLPSPAQYVTVNRWRVTGSVEHVYAFSKTPHPKWDNRRVLVPYSDAMRKRIAAGGERGARRPSGHTLAAGAFAADNLGAIPRNLLDISASCSRSAYFTYCQAEGLPVHPARFPEALAEFMVKLTSEPGDLVYDPFGGSLTTAAVCERLDRRWVTSERSLTYLAGARPRLADVPGFTDCLGRAS